MRKLVYVGKDNNGAIVTTTSYEEMKMHKANGFIFSERMEEVKEEYKPTERAKKIAEKFFKKA